MESEAYYIVKPGTPEKAFELRNHNVEDVGADEVLIEVEGFGLNYADVMARLGLYRGAPDFPCVVGYEVVGKIIQGGGETDPSKIGKRVIAFTRFGGYAKHVKTLEKAVVPISENAAGEELLALCTQGVTAYYMAEYLTPVRENDIVLIHAAAGGVGTVLIQLAKAKGAKVIAKVGSDNKRELVTKLGADFVVNYNKGDYASAIDEFLGGQRLDISFNPVAGATYKKDMALLGSGGRMILFGGSDIARGKWGILSKLNFVRKMGLLLPIALMIKSKNVLGVNMLEIADNKPEVLEHCLQEVYKLYESGVIKPQVGGKYKSNELNAAHSALESGTTTGKLSVFWS